MKALEETISELIYNSNMGGNQCMYETDRKNVRGILYIDRDNWIKVGDVVRIERDNQGNYIKMFINGVLNTAFKSRE